MTAERAMALFLAFLTTALVIGGLALAFTGEFNG